MCFLYAVYAVDVVATAIAASALADTLDTMEQLGDSIHAVSDAMTQLLGTTTLNADQKLDEGRLQFKLAAAEARLYFFSQFITLDLKKLILIIFSLNERALSPKKVTFDNDSAGERPSVPDVGCQND